MGQLIQDLEFSRLVVGTCQFGLSYGVANRTGRPDFEQVCRILDCAAGGGATTLDTAPGYGDSEALLGRALKETGLLDRVTVVTKVKPIRFMEEEQSAANIRNWIRDSVLASLSHLGLESLPLCLFHQTGDIAHMDVLLDLKEEGLVRHTGASVFTPEQMDEVVSTPGVEAIQVAASMLDRRVSCSGQLGEAVVRGMTVFVRSIYLQGLVVMPPGDIMPELHEAAPVLRSLRDIAAGAGLTMPEMALRYGLSLPGVTGVLTGVETEEQMAANLGIAAAGPLPEEVFDKIDAAVPELPDTVLNPWHWPGAIR